MNVLILKDRIRERDGNKCVDCGMTDKEHRGYCGKSLHVHRLEKTGPYSLANTVTLCRCCHELRHGKTMFFAPDVPCGTGKTWERPRWVRIDVCIRKSAKKKLKKFGRILAKERGFGRSLGIGEVINALVDMLENQIGEAR